MEVVEFNKWSKLVWVTVYIYRLTPCALDKVLLSWILIDTATIYKKGRLLGTQFGTAFCFGDVDWIVY